DPDDALSLSRHRPPVGRDRDRSGGTRRSDRDLPAYPVLRPYLFVLRFQHIRRTGVAHPALRRGDGTRDRPAVRRAGRSGRRDDLHRWRDAVAPGTGADRSPGRRLPVWLRRAAGRRDHHGGQSEQLRRGPRRRVSRCGRQPAEPRRPDPAPPRAARAGPAARGRRCRRSLRRRAPGRLRQHQRRPDLR
ncbi:MAG: Hypothetical radical SAM family enzyme in heat shock gene cluster, similarity with CPO of BS HemN-type, partial [uncultured Thermomicrobiales bacterium]